MTTLTYDCWEMAITDLVSERLEVPYSDASGIIEANEFLMAQSWSLDLTPEETAKKILKK